MENGERGRVEDKSAFCLRRWSETAAAATECAQGDAPSAGISPDKQTVGYKQKAPH